MSDQLTNYFVNRRKKVEGRKTEKVNLKARNQKIESHHISGRINSEKQILLLKEFHDYISCFQDSLPVELRKNNEIMAITSSIGFFELGIRCLRELREIKINEVKDEK